MEKSLKFVLFAISLGGMILWSDQAGAQEKAPRENNLASISFGIMGAMPMQANFTKTHTVGGGGQVKLRIPLSESGKNQITATIRPLSYFGKDNPNDLGKYKQRNVLQFMAGYRYNFDPEADKAFYVEPALGLALVGTKSTVFKYETAVGYYLNDRFDIGIWHQIGFGNFRNTKIGAIGLMLNISFNNMF